MADKENTRRSSICVWGETVNTAVYLDKRSHTKAINKKTPFEAFSSRKPGVRQMRVFGSICYAQIPLQLRHKYDENDNKGIFMGCGNYEKRYIVLNLNI